MPKKIERKTVGYRGNQNTPREREWYCALSDRVGHKDASEYADEIINFKQGKPPPHIMRQWLFEYDEGRHGVSDEVRAKVDLKVDRFHKQQHMSLIRKMIKAGKKSIDVVEDTGDMPNPVLIKYIADGVNQGMMLHNTRTQQQESLGLPGLTINIGKQPPPRKLRQKDVDRFLEADFTLIGENASASSDG